MHDSVLAFSRRRPEFWFLNRLLRNLRLGAAGLVAEVLER